MLTEDSSKFHKLSSIISLWVWWISKRLMALARFSMCGNGQPRIQSMVFGLRDLSLIMGVAGFPECDQPYSTWKHGTATPDFIFLTSRKLSVRMVVLITIIKMMKKGCVRHATMHASTAWTHPLMSASIVTRMEITGFWQMLLASVWMDTSTMGPIPFVWAV